MKKLISIFFLAVLILSSGNFQIAHAATTPTPTYPYNLTWNIRSIYFYTDGNAELRYGMYINNAAHNWCYTGWGNSLYPATRTYDSSTSAIDFHTYSVADGANGFTQWRIFGSTVVIDPYSRNWDWGAIYLNDNYLIGVLGTNVQAVVAHEMGHVFGLGHNNTNPNSIMCQEASGRAVYTVQKVDNDAFNLKHP